MKRALAQFRSTGAQLFLRSGIDVNSYAVRLHSELTKPAKRIGNFKINFEESCVPRRRLPMAATCARRMQAKKRDERMTTIMLLRYKCRRNGSYGVALRQLALKVTFTTGAGVRDLIA